MKHFYFFLIFLLFSNSILYSQSILDLYPKYFASFGKIYGEKIERINGREDQILKYDQVTFDTYKGEIDNPEAIKNVEIQITKDLDLQKAFKDLALFPNLYYLKLSNFKLFSDPVFLDIPKDFSAIKNVELFHMEGDLGWDFKELSNRLTNFPKLKHLAINALAKEKFSQLDLEKLSQLKGLYISGREGAIIPEDIKELKNLEGIVISADLYPDFEDQFKKLKSLSSLRQVKLLYFKIENEKEIFRDFGKLERLELTNVNVNDLNNLLTSFPSDNNLKYLEIFGSKSIHFTGGLLRLPRLEYLKLERLGDSIFFPEEIYDLKNLKDLTLSDNKNFTTVPSKIKNLEKLERLTLHFNSLENLPEEIGFLENLEYLNLQKNSIESLPESLGRLNSLEILKVNTNKLKDLPESTGELKNLVELDLETNRLERLPKSFPGLSSLEILRLNGNDLIVLLKDFGQLKELRKLQLDQNLLQELPFSFSKLSSLESLSLRNNNLSALPAVNNLKKLKHFNISNHSSALKISYYDPGLNEFVEDTTRQARKNNNISKLPSGFAELQNLEVINISENPVETSTLWEVLSNLKSTDYILMAGHAGIKYLPTEGWENIKAKSIFLRDNRISFIPPNITRAPNLENIDLSGNPFALSGSYETKEKLAVVLYEAGQLREGLLERTNGTAQAYLDLSYQRKNRKSRLEFMKKAFRVDSAYTSNNIRETEYAEALLEGREFYHAIDIFTQAIQKDTANNVRILNFTVPLFENRAQAYLNIGDTLAAINDLQIVSRKFNAGNWGEAGLLAIKIKNDSLARDSFQSGLEDYERQIEWNEKNNRVNFGYQLSKLELLIIAEEFEKANKYYAQLVEEEMSNVRNEILLKYFGLILKTISGDLSRIEISQFRQKMLDEKIKISGWSFELFQKWLYHAQLPDEKILKMEELTEILKESV